MTSPVKRRAHARLRAQQRYGMALSKTLRRELLRMIRSGEAIQSARLTHTRTAHLLEHGGRRIAVIYSNTTKDLVTLLPPDCWELNGPQPEKGSI